MPGTLKIPMCFLLVSVGLVACFDSRKDPCQLLTVQDMKSLDESIATSVWAGRDGERKEDEVCAFYADDGDPRAMLFVWYDDDKKPVELARLAAAATNGEVEGLTGIGSQAAAYYQGEELKLLAVKSAQGVVAIRAKSSIKKDSMAFDQLALLAERALSRNK